MKAAQCSKIQGLGHYLKVADTVWTKRHPTDHHDDEFDDQGNMRYHWFEFPRTGEWSWTDPRLSPKALKNRGPQIQDFAIV
jgi:hypothetical protein